MCGRTQMKLSILLKSIDRMCKTQDAQITVITDDSRKCTENSIFVCRDSAVEYVSDAQNRKAAAIIAESEVCDGCIVVENAAQAYSTLCRCFFDYPDEKLKIMAVTGTNGKTTVASMVSHIMEMNGRKCGLFSTVVNKTVTEEASQMTTSDSFEFNRMLSELVDNQIGYCAIEASSQGLDEERLFGVNFDIAVLTNISRDHLDYHETFENYKNAKKKLFKNSRLSVINYDDACKDEFIQSASGRVLTYSTKDNEADFTAKSIRISESGIDYALVANSLIHRIKLDLRGDFNVENSMAATICAMQWGLSLDECAAALRTFSAVKGRLEVVDAEADFKVIIDYAHTPDGLRRVLLSLGRICSGRLIVVFGCGGDRDKGKRQEMGKIAANSADMVIITSDNPRTEPSLEIIDEILCGTSKSRTPIYVKENRREAIKFALSKAGKNDIVLLAGKGHEAYQIIGEEKFNFDEREEVRQIINNR